MYMDEEYVYTVAEFRKRLREAFNEADDNVDVVIERHGKKYWLITDSYYQLLHEPDSSVGLPPPPVAKKPKESLPSELAPRFCKNGHPIPYPRDKCLGKKCKYA